MFPCARVALLFELRIYLGVPRGGGGEGGVRAFQIHSPFFLLAVSVRYLVSVTLCFFIDSLCGVCDVSALQSCQGEKVGLF